jgi:hypothetical protein
LARIAASTAAATDEASATISATITSVTAAITSVKAARARPGEPFAAITINNSTANKIAHSTTLTNTARSSASANYD